MAKLQISNQNSLDVDFIYMSYDEEYADEGYQSLLEKIPDAKRVHGVKGIANAWKKAADISESDYFITMDADTELLSSFSFTASDFIKDDERIHVWRSLNPVNGLIYGHGSIHMFPKRLVQEFTNTNVVDFTLNVGTKGFCIQEECATVTRFNRSPQLTWRSAFREASKLASQTNMYVGTSNEWINNDPVSMHRLFVWCSIGMDAEYGYYSILGARQGAIHGFMNKNNPEKLAEISDYDNFNDTADPLDLNSYRYILKSVYNFNVQDFTAEQSRELKKLWYSINSDVISRLNHKIDVLSE